MVSGSYRAWMLTIGSNWVLQGTNDAGCGVGKGVGDVVGEKVGENVGEIVEDGVGEHVGDEDGVIHDRT